MFLLSPIDFLYVSNEPALRDPGNGGSFCFPAGLSPTCPRFKQSTWPQSLSNQERACMYKKSFFYREKYTEPFLCFIIKRNNRKRIFLKRINVQQGIMRCGELHS